jgi:hypothetical protein
MKRSAVRHEAQSEEQSQESEFQLFAKVMGALVAVPKRGIEEKLADEKTSASAKPAQ